MAITTQTLVYDSNAFAPRPAGDLAHAIYDIVIDTGPNAYPQGGEPITFAEFRDLKSVEIALANPGPAFGAADAVGAMVPVFQRGVGVGAINLGAIRLYIGAVGNLAELAVGAYPNALAFQIIVHGQPATDAATQ